MKVLNVCSTINPVLGGGEAERSFQMSLYLKKSGADCHMLTVDTNLPADRKKFLGVDNMTVLPCLSQRFYIPRPPYAVISRLVKNSDIVHLMGHWTILNALTYLVIKKYNKKYVVCPAGALPIFGRSRILKRIYNFIIGKAIIANATMCIAVTKKEVDSFAAYGVPPSRIKVIPNGVSQIDFIHHDNQKFRQIHKLGEKPFILFTGRLNLIKGPDLLLNAFIEIADQFPDVNLVFVGPDSGLLQELLSTTRKSNLQERIFFLGYLGGKQKAHAYHAADLLVIPSRQEAMSIVVLEAGVCGTPVLITDQCGFDEIAAESAGWVVPATKEAIKNGLIDILKNTQSLYSAGLNLHNFVLNQFAWHTIVENYRSLYLDILGRGSSSISPKPEMLNQD